MSDSISLGRRQLSCGSWSVQRHRLRRVYSNFYAGSTLGDRIASVLRLDSRSHEGGDVLSLTELVENGHYRVIVRVTEP